jgi:glucose-6-phosphate isomerase
MRAGKHRDAMFAGEAINTTEQRAVMHWLLRNPAPALADIAQGATKSIATQWQTYWPGATPCWQFADAVRADGTITDVVNIGIGGSDLGPQMAVRALDEFATRDKRFHFVSNVDGHALAAVLRGLNPASTCFWCRPRPSPRSRP